MININELTIAQVLSLIKEAQLPLTVLDEIHDDKKDNALETVLMKAIYKSHPFKNEVLEWLKTMPLELIDYEHENYLQWNILHMAVLTESHNEVKILLERKKDRDYGYASEYYFSLFQSAIASNNLEMMKLVYQYDKDVYYINQEKKMALHYIVEKEDRDVILFILELYKSEDIEKWQKEFCDEQFNSFLNTNKFFEQHKRLIDSTIERKYLEETMGVSLSKQSKSIKI